MIRLLACALIFCLTATSCSLLGMGGKDKKKEPHPFGPTGIPPQLRARTEGDPATPGAGAVPGQGPAIPLENDLVFTDPDNPDADLPELSTLLAAPKKGPWERSETIARQRASREGKPVLIWFTDSSNSPMCKALSDELFSKPEFEAWASEKLVRLRVDSNDRMPADEARNLTSDEKLNRESELRTYATDLKKRYKVLGAPNLVMLNPSGEVLAKYRGYKRGDADFTWGLIKQGEASSASAYQSWRSDLEKKGYRQWEDNKGRKVFAKLLNYHDGELIFMEPDGTRSKTQESRLSSTDKAWIAQQKTLRGIH